MLAVTSGRSICCVRRSEREERETGHKTRLAVSVRVDGIRKKKSKDYLDL